MVFFVFGIENCGISLVFVLTATCLVLKHRNPIMFNEVEEHVARDLNLLLHTEPVFILTFLSRVLLWGYCEMSARKGLGLPIF